MTLFLSEQKAPCKLHKAVKLLDEAFLGRTGPYLVGITLHNRASRHGRRHINPPSVRPPESRRKTNTQFPLTDHNYLAQPLSR